MDGYGARRSGGCAFGPVQPGGGAVSALLGPAAVPGPGRHFDADGGGHRRAAAAHPGQSRAAARIVRHGDGVVAERPRPPAGPGGGGGRGAARFGREAAPGAGTTSSPLPRSTGGEGLTQQSLEAPPAAAACRLVGATDRAGRPRIVGGGRVSLLDRQGRSGVRVRRSGFRLCGGQGRRRHAGGPQDPAHLPRPGDAAREGRVRAGSARQGRRPQLQDPDVHRQARRQGGAQGLVRAQKGRGPAGRAGGSVPAAGGRLVQASGRPAGREAGGRGSCQVEGTQPRLRWQGDAQDRAVGGDRAGLVGESQGHLRAAGPVQTACL